ncbi:single-stranded DNA-binding protein [Crocinitomix catalasitica]|uniref:single-stranded DNA-binding protein n=1 Tax=Crocinitomix catalasitica TaxID=184607 RepID=UPI00048889FE|nr:single-stranded DNA-binding protein [Crocinitomix catalasitica]
MATVFETRLIGNIGKDAVVRQMDKGIVAINFPVAHNKNWRDKKTGEQKTKTTWVNCTIWKKDNINTKIAQYLVKGTLVEVIGTPFSKGYLQDDNTIKSEIRINVAKTNILKSGNSQRSNDMDEDDNDDFNASIVPSSFDEEMD